jgi:hypothetical protein
MNEMHDIHISDAHLAAYLLARGFRISRIAGSPGRREFVFTEVSGDALVTFYGGDDRISARALLDALKNIKGLIAQPLVPA